jgi:hypothetical protein
MNDDQNRKPGHLGAAGAATAGAGVSLVATVAGSCCLPIVAPLTVALLGASGAAWAAGLKPYSPYLIGTSFFLLISGFWMVYRPRPATDMASCPLPSSRGSSAVKWLLWLATLIWLASVLLNYLPELTSWLTRA